MNISVTNGISILLYRKRNLKKNNVSIKNNNIIKQILHMHDKKSDKPGLKCSIISKNLVIWNSSIILNCSVIWNCSIIVTYSIIPNYSIGL